MFENVIPLIEQIVNDRTVPRNIRTRCQESIEVLKDGGDVAIRISTVISNMDEVSNDPNIPMYTRTQVWNIVSILESMQK
ncbi:MAG: hypothetical protein GTN40_04445 [Candidatus Aenigmarchaeota archaeon]|nr:hypothetical protein [Candidatus Aenigmarchaeota archaeon]